MRSEFNFIKYGELSEWSKEHAWKVCVPQGTEGSNPSFSAILLPQVYDTWGFFIYSP